MKEKTIYIKPGLTEEQLHKALDVLKNYLDFFLEEDSLPKGNALIPCEALYFDNLEVVLEKHSDLIGVAEVTYYDYYIKGVYWFFAECEKHGITPVVQWDITKLKYNVVIPDPEIMSENGDFDPWKAMYRTLELTNVPVLWCAFPSCKTLAVIWPEV